MSTKPVRVAVIGTGLIGPRHAEAVLSDPDTELVCIVDPNPAAETIAQRLKCSLYSSIEEMLVSPVNPEAAIVCTPNHTHVPVSKQLLNAGLHVLCEKPISVDIASGKDLVRSSKYRKCSNAGLIDVRSSTPLLVTDTC